MNRKLLSLAVLATIVFMGLIGPVSADTIPYAYNPEVPVFDYHFPDSSSDLSAGSVVDLSTAGNNATTYGFSTAGLSDNVPAGYSGKSIDCGSINNVRGVRTLGVDMLDPQTVAQHGGFLMDVWFYNTNPMGGMQDIISNELKDNLRVRDGLIRFNIDNRTQPHFNLATSQFVQANEWYHVVAVFDTAENEAVYGDPEGIAGTEEFWYVQGNMYLYVNDVEVGRWENQVDTLITDANYNNIDRPIGIGIHPDTTVRNFAGQIYDPKISFLHAPVPEPSTLALLAMGILGLICYAWRKK